MYVAQYRPLTVRMVTRNEDGTAGNNTGDVTVTVLDASGATVASGTAPNDGGNGTGAHAYTPPTSVTNTLGAYTVRFIYVLDGVTYRREVPYEVTGGHLFEIDELRSFDPAIADANSYTAAEIRDARDKATDRLERAAQVAFSTRSKTVTLSGDGTPRLILPDSLVQSVLTVEVDGDAVVDGFEVLPQGVLIRTDGGGWSAASPQNVLVEYEHGYEVCPAPASRAAMMLAIEYLVPSALPARAMSQSTDLGEFRVSIANVDAGRSTGIPEVDAVIAEFGRRRPSVA